MSGAMNRGGGVFYGWWVVAASMVGLALSWPTIAIYTFSPFVIPLAEEFGWQRSQISFAVTVVSHSAMIMSILLGFVVDRLGVRRIMLPSILLLGFTVASLYWLTPSLSHLYAAFLAIAVLGAGTSVLAFSKLVLNWFDRKRGVALGFTMAGVGVGAALLPLFVTYVITHYGWREAYLGMGLMTLILSGGINAALIRERPEQMGLARDGSAPGGPALPAMAANAGYTARQAMRTRQFWLMLISFFLVGVCATGSTAHLVPLLRDRGIDAAQAAGMASSLGIAVIFGRILAGYLMDRFFAPVVAIGFMSGPVLGLALLALGATGAGAFVAAILVGLAIGAEFDILGYFVSRYAGLKAFGRVYGLMLASFQLGGGIGPVIMGLGFDRAGSYTAVLWAFAGLFVITCILLAGLGPYPKFAVAGPENCNATGLVRGSVRRHTG